MPKNSFFDKDNAMATSATTQSITNGQIGQIQDRLATKLRESNLPMKGVQAVLSAPGAGKVIEGMVAVLRKFVEMAVNMIVRIAYPNRKLTPRKALEATGRNLYVDDQVLANMPRGKGKKAEVVFFKPDLSLRGGCICDDDLEKEYELRGLKPADPYSLAKVNQDDPAFADSRPNCTHWKDTDGKWCYASFGGYGEERGVGCGRRVVAWVADWSFAGLRK